MRNSQNKSWFNAHYVSSTDLFGISLGNSLHHFKFAADKHDSCHWVKLTIYNVPSCGKLHKGQWKIDSKITSYLILVLANLVLHNEVRQRNVDIEKNETKKTFSQGTSTTCLSAKSIKEGKKQDSRGKNYENCWKTAALEPINHPTAYRLHSPTENIWTQQWVRAEGNRETSETTPWQSRKSRHTISFKNQFMEEGKTGLRATNSS